MVPGAVRGQRVVDRQQPTGGGHGIHPVLSGPSEVDPADVTECVGVATIGGQLLTGYEGDAISRAGAGQLLLMAHGVVVGHGEDVEPCSDGRRRELGHTEQAIRVHGVGMQVAGKPNQTWGSGQVTARWALRYGGRRRCGHRRVYRGDKQFYGHLDTRGRNPVQAENHRPGPGLRLAGVVAGRRGRRTDGEPVASGTGPAPEASWARTAEVHNRSTPVIRKPNLQRPPPARTSNGISRYADAARSSGVIRRSILVLMSSPVGWRAGRST